MNHFKSLYDKYFYNGSFNLDDIDTTNLNDNDIEKMNSIVNQYRINDYGVNNAAEYILRDICMYLDKVDIDRNKQPLRAFSYEKLQEIKFDNEEYLVRLLANSIYEGFKDILEYQLDEETEIKYIWRY